MTTPSRHRSQSLRRSNSQLHSRQRSPVPADLILEDDPDFQLTRPRNLTSRNSSFSSPHTSSRHGSNPLQRNSTLISSDYFTRESATAVPDVPQRPTAVTRRRTTLYNKNIFTDTEMELTSIQPLARSRPSRDSALTLSTFSGNDDEDIDFSDTAKLTQRKDSLHPLSQKIPARDPSGSDHVPDLESQTHARPATIIPSKSLAAIGTVLQRASTRVVNLNNKEKLGSSANPPPVPPLPSNPFSQTIKKQQKTTKVGKEDLEMEETMIEEVEEKSAREPVADFPSTIRRRSTPALVGKSLGIFGPENIFRQWLYRILTDWWTETFILIIIFLNAIILTVQAWGGVQQREQGWGNDWTDFLLLGIFTIYTLEIIGRIIVHGLIFDPAPPLSSSEPSSPPVRHSKTSFLRHSWNRIDFLAVISYWIDLALIFLNMEFTNTRHIFVFKMLSAFRLLRLLNVTAGSATILQSLKKSAPLLINVGGFVGFFFVLFAIIGVQAFKGSYLRRCVWTDPTNSSHQQILQKYCGGSYDVNGAPISYIAMDTKELVNLTPKGFLCPYPCQCMEMYNAFNNTISFDNIAVSALLVFIVAGVENWTDRMYEMMDSEYAWSCIYFIVIVVVMNFWLINLFIAVITETFAKIREDSEGSAFVDKKVTSVLADTEEGWSFSDPSTKKVVPSPLARYVEALRPFWIVCVFFDLAVMGLKTAEMDDQMLYILDIVELAFTLGFAFEIVLRFLATLPNWRTFFKQMTNKVDLFLAVITCFILLPPIHFSSAYPYLTVFQIARVYRIIMTLRRMRVLMGRVLGSVIGLVNLFFFIVLLHYIVAIIAVQLLRGVIPMLDNQSNPIEMRFFSIFNSFLSLYQLFTGENWTDVLYHAMSYDTQWGNTWIDALFLVLWFAFSNFVLLNMFIAIIMENFETAEHEKRKRQIETFIAKVEEGDESHRPLISRWNIYRYFKPKPRRLAVDSIPATLVLPMQKNIVREFLSEHEYGLDDAKKKMLEEDTSAHFYQSSAHGLAGELAPLWNSVRRVLRISSDYDHKPLVNQVLKKGFQFDNRRESTRRSTDPNTNLIFGFDPVLLETFAYRPAEATREDLSEREAQKREFITAHPMYDKSLWIFSPSNRLRRWCQLLVVPGRGQRTFGTPHNELLSSIFTTFIFTCVIVNVVLTAMNTPLTEKYQQELPPEQRSQLYWYAEIAFTIIFTVEFLIRIIADGFALTPNAYLLNAWNNLDFFVLLTLYIAFFSNVTHSMAVSRAFRAFKALRALRLINLLTAIQDTFDAILVAGLPHILDAAALSLCLIIPFALYGQNIFQGQFYGCNDNFDSSIANKSQCVGEWVGQMQAPAPLGATIYMPRAWTNPYIYSFDSFWKSLLLLFEIVSGEGWINVEITGMQISGYNQSPVQDSSQLNAIFFMIYNLVGSVFVLELFLGVVIENFTKRNGSAYLTVEQRRWLDLKKLLGQVRPSKRPEKAPTGWFRRWCYDRAVNKRGWLAKTMTIIIILNMIVLCTEFRTQPAWVDTTKDFIYLSFILVYFLELLIKLIGIGWHNFRKNSWNIYDLMVIVGSSVTTFAILANDRSQVTVDLQRLFLTAICFKLVQKSDSLNQLFKTISASAPQILNLLGVWFVVLTTYAIIFVEIFGLTKYGSQVTNDHISFRNWGLAMLTLLRFSTGEGWNVVMHDYTVTYPFCVDTHTDFLESDCGSVAWAYALFLTFNIISMYIFTSMFVVVVLNSFSYVYQIGAGFSLLTRDEIRNYKKAWAIFDPIRLGILRAENYVPFFRSLTGAFEMKVYGDEFSVKNMLRQCSGPPTIGHAKSDPYEHNLDIQALNRMLDRMNVSEVHARRIRMSQLYWESISEGAAKNGIQFNQMLLMLAQNKLINSEESLLLEELLQYRRKTEQIQMLVNIDRVKGMLETIVFRRKFLRYRQMRKLQQQWAADGGLPSIVVESSTTFSDDIDTAPLKTWNPLPPSPGSSSPNETPLAEPSITDYFSGPRNRGSMDYRGSPAAESPLRASFDMDLENSDNEMAAFSFDSDHDDEQITEHVMNSSNVEMWHDLLEAETTDNQ